MINKSELTKEYYPPKDVAKYLGVTTRTLFTWGDKGLIEYVETVVDGTVSRRLYKREALINKLDEMGVLFDDTVNKRRDIVYARVSTHKQKERGDLERQLTTLKLYASDKNPVNLLSLTDVGSRR